MSNILIIILIVILLVCVLIVAFRSSDKSIYYVTEAFNKVLGMNCSDSAVLNPNDYEWTRLFRDKWLDIRNEFLTYAKSNNIPLHKQINRITGSCDTKNKWKTLFLKAFNVDTNLCKHFPITKQLIDNCPCTLAFFSILEPGARLIPHVGIFKGVLRYHLGLIVPNETEKCYLNIDGKKLHWKEGSDIMFDDMFEHYAVNETSEPRVVLFMDIQRDFSNGLINWLNKKFIQSVRTNDALADTIKNINDFSSSIHSQNPNQTVYQ